MIRAALIAVFVLKATIVAGQTSISLDQVDGLFGQDTLTAGADIRFHLRFSNQSGSYMVGFSHGFTVYSQDGALRDSVKMTSNGILENLFDGGFFANYFSNDGTGTDTIGVGGLTIHGDGLPDGFDQVVFSLDFHLPASSDGKTVCLDTAFFPPGGIWVWALTGTVKVLPSWDGPHCFEISLGTLDVIEQPSVRPDEFLLHQNFPNPFNPVTNISFVFPQRSHYQLEIFDITGRTVKEFHGESPAGQVTVKWDAKGMASGVYFYRLTAGEFTSTRKMVLLK